MPRQKIIAVYSLLAHEQVLDDPGCQHTVAAGQGQECPFRVKRGNPQQRKGVPVWLRKRTPELVPENRTGG
jgi:hypothetical protein